MSKVNSIVPKSRFRRLTKSGVFSAARLNATFEELVQEIQELQAFHNDKLVPLLNGLPLGADDDEFPAIGTSLDPILNGLSGDQIWADDSASSTSDDIFWSETDSRKLTLKESLLSLSDRVNSNFATVQSLIEDLDAGASSYTRGYIGLKAFDEGLSSASSSIDGRTSINNLNISQLQADAFGGNYALDSDGAANLTYPLQQVVDALLDLHDGAAYKSGLTHSTTITLSGATVSTGDLTLTTLIPSTWIGPVLPIASTLSRATSITTIAGEIMRLRFEISRLRGPSSNWNDDTGLAPFGSIISLEQHMDLSGTATKTALNPHGMHADDVPYDNTTSGLTATDVNAAIDEVVSGGVGGESLATTLGIGNTTGGTNLIISGGDAINGAGFSKLKTDVSAQATSISVNITTDVGKFFTNEGAAALVIFTLPSAVVGLHYYFYNQDANDIRVLAATGDTIRLGSVVSASAGNIESSAIGDSIKLVAINSTEWVVAGGFTGIWAVT